MIEKRWVMKSLKMMCIHMLCEFGKFGVGKSLILGMYDIEPPEKLKRYINDNKKEKNILSNQD